MIHWECLGETRRGPADGAAALLGKQVLELSQSDPIAVREVLVAPPRVVALLADRVSPARTTSKPVELREVLDLMASTAFLLALWSVQAILNEPRSPHDGSAVGVVVRSALAARSWRLVAAFHNTGNVGLCCIHQSHPGPQ